jgi:iduronate 2-sulfatase
MLMRLTLRWIGALVAGWLGMMHASTGIAAGPPNVLLICVDDLKPIPGCFGGAAVTPAIDRLAARGVRFDMAFCNQAVCSPSRNSLLTSLRPQTLGIYDLGTNFRRARPDAITLPQAFQAAGYSTESLGKIFHVGHGNTDDEASWSVPSWKADVVAYQLAASKTPRGKTREEALFSNQPADNLPRGAAWESADVADNAYPDGAMADEVVRRLREKAASKSGPFFMAVGFMKPHLPFCAPQKYWDMYDPAKLPAPEVTTAPLEAPDFALTKWAELRQYRDMPERGPVTAELQQRLIHGYYAATSYMDAQLGRVLDALDETSLAGSTIIVFWGDHGWHLGDHGMWCKHSNYEQATRIPVIVAGPGVAEGQPASALIETVDIYPTLCELAGVAIPAGLEGVSFAATARHPELPARDYVQHVYPRSERFGRAVRTSTHRLVEWKSFNAGSTDVVYELYDLDADPAETRNHATEQPEVVAELAAILARQPSAIPQLKSPPAPASRGASDPKSGAKPQDRNAMFDRRDSNKDGQLTLDEFLQFQPDPEVAPFRFKTFDVDGDGTLSRDEFVSSGRKGRAN